MARRNDITASVHLNVVNMKLEIRDSGTANTVQVSPITESRHAQRFVAKLNKKDLSDLKLSELGSCLHHLNQIYEEQSIHILQHQRLVR